MMPVGSNEEHKPVHDAMTLHDEFFFDKIKNAILGTADKAKTAVQKPRTLRKEEPKVSSEEQQTPPTPHNHNHNQRNCPRSHRNRDAASLDRTRHSTIPGGYNRVSNGCARTGGPIPDAAGNTGRRWDPCSACSPT